MTLPANLENLSESLASLPGIGRRMASRIAIHLFRDKVVSQNLIHEVLELDKLKFCNKCGIVSDFETCEVCSGERLAKIMVVEEYFDVVSIEEVGEYEGYYFILGGLLSPLKAIMPENLRIGALISRVAELLENSTELEVIFALNPSFEGETTINYLKQELLEKTSKDRRSMLQFTRLGIGLPKGSDLDYADTETLKYALKLRGEV
ncbi:recombination protein RecR [bacterium]|nr:MAG: recombination protein RecR [bacterium]